MLLAATLSSSYGIYGPVFELGESTPVSGKEEYTDNEKYEIRQWQRDSYTKIREVLIRINRIRQQHPALQQYTDIHFLPVNNDQIIAYYKTAADGSDTMIVVVNLDPFHTREATLTLPASIAGRQYHFAVHDLLSGDRYDWHTGENYVRLNPYDLPAHILHLQ
ncbi:MAG: alpha-glucosidase C-terminal domain-containing protein [Chitinophagaceae bacterium]